MRMFIEVFVPPFWVIIARTDTFLSSQVLTSYFFTLFPVFFFPPTAWSFSHPQFTPFPTVFAFNPSSLLSDPYFSLLTFFPRSFGLYFPLSISLSLFLHPFLRVSIHSNPFPFSLQLDLPFLRRVPGDVSPISPLLFTRWPSANALVQPCVHKSTRAFMVTVSLCFFLCFPAPPSHLLTRDDHVSKDNAATTRSLPAASRSSFYFHVIYPR